MRPRPACNPQPRTVSAWLLGGLRVVGVGVPCRTVLVVGLVAPHSPLLADAPREQLKVRPRRAGFDHLVLLIRLPRVLPLARRNVVHLGSTRLKRSRVLPSNAEQD